MDKQQQLSLELDMNVLNHLGVGLYSSTPAVVTEIIANAWDADATEVKIEINPDSSTICVQDNGHGMSIDDLQGKFLRVGYARRDQAGGAHSPEYARPVMGRKGIGKLGMFSLADLIDIWTRKDGADPVAARIDVNELKKAIDKNQKYVLGNPDTTYEWSGKAGTRIVLSRLHTGIDKTEGFLRSRIARRFSVLGSGTFEVLLNGTPVGPADRGYQKDVQFVWYFDDTARDNLLALAPNVARDKTGDPCVRRIDGNLDPARPNLTLRGFIATVDRPKKLMVKDANINQISLFARGRIFQEDVLGELGNSAVFNSYLVGEVHADFLDEDSVDRATANREAVKHGDPLVIQVRNRLSIVLKEISKQWDDWRVEVGVDIDDEQVSAALKTWLDSLQDKRDRVLAERLIGSIARIETSNDESKNKETKRDLLRSTIIGFEKLRIRKRLDRLEHVADVLSPEFQAIFHDVDDIEATYYHDITSTRLKIIERFNEVVDSQALEKVAQEYLFNHLWLLDPTWDRVSGSEVMEQTLTGELKKIVPDAETGARLDIAYRTSSGRHVIVELKRPGKSVNVYRLMEQGDKYRGAMLSLIHI